MTVKVLVGLLSGARPQCLAMGIPGSENKGGWLGASRAVQFLVAAEDSSKTVKYRVVITDIRVQCRQ